MEGNRREFLRKSALTGAVMWAAPVVTTLPKAAAGPGSPVACPCTTCTGQATALRVTSPVLNAEFPSPPTTNGCVCAANVSLGTALGVQVLADVACAKVDPATCSASSYLSNLSVRITSLVRLRATLLSSCVDCLTGASTVANLRITIAGITTNLMVNAGCNTGIVVPAIIPGVLGLAIVANDQSCSGNQLTVRALRVTIALLGGTVEVVVGESRVSGSGVGCNCVACSPAPRCMPPTGPLC